MNFPDFKNFMGPKGKCPWITDDDGTVVADSQFIIEHLIRKHNIEVPPLSPEDAAVARSMRALVEDNLYFAIVADFTIYGCIGDLLKIYPRFVPASAPDFLQKLILRRIWSTLGKQTKAQGIGRHTRLACILIKVYFWPMPPWLIDKLDGQIVSDQK